MSRSRSWLCTWNNFPEDWQAIITGCGAVDYSAQKEKGKDAEGEHIQFAVRFEDAKSFKTVQELFKGAHIEPAKNWFKAKQYCMKKDTQVEIGITKEEMPKCRDPLAGKTLRPIQSKILDIIKGEPDDRTIHWFHDPEGGAGKTSLAKHICLNNKDAIYLTGKSADMKFGVMKFLEDEEKGLKTVIIDLTRSVEAFISYQGIEEIKNGIFYNTKYESGMVMFDNPHIIILSNFMPNFEMLSADRWALHEIEPMKKEAENMPEITIEGYDDENDVFVPQKRSIAEILADVTPEMSETFDEILEEETDGKQEADD